MIFFETEFRPCAAMINCCHVQQAIAAISSAEPFSAVGAAAKRFSPIQPVVKETSDSQNSKRRFAHSIDPATSEVAERFESTLVHRASREGSNRGEIEDKHFRSVTAEMVKQPLTLERDGFAHFSRSPKACLGVARVALRVSSLPCVRAWSPRAGALFRAAPSVAARGEPRCYRVSIDPDGSGSARPLELTILFFKGFNHF